MSRMVLGSVSFGPPADLINQLNLRDSRVMKVFVCTDHDEHYPVGAASVIIAENEQQASSLLREELQRRGLKGEGFTLKEIDLSAPIAVVLCDGNY